jgi:hypothetical protein
VPASVVEPFSDQGAFERAIEESADLLGDGAARDEEEAPASLPAARERAIGFLRAHATQARRLGFELPVPRICAGPGGSVDVHWKLDDFEILVNFPPNPDEPVTFYGDNEGSDSIRGTIGSDREPRSLLPWLILSR